MKQSEQIELEMNNISIAFPGVQALAGVDFRTATGSSHALIGANGAGKSTLMKVLSGAYGHYTGSIRIGGREVNIRSPKDAKDLGIQIVYQEVDTALIPYLTVGENIMLDDMVAGMGKKQLVRWRELHRRAQDILNKINVRVSSKTTVSELSLAEKQMVLIARAISKSCRFLILDEPTAPLSRSETDQLFRIVRELKRDHVGVIFISHRLPELYEICDEITVMRDGKFVVKANMAEIAQHEVVEHMLGRKLEQQFPKEERVIGEIGFEARRFSDPGKIDHIDFYVRKGEIVGLAGLVGAGKTELCKALFGASESASGERLLHGAGIRVRTPYDAVKQGIALVPEERRKEGVLVGESVVANLTAASLAKFCTWGQFVSGKRERTAAAQIIGDLGIKTPDEQTVVRNLSGGNQQKVAIGKWLIADAEVYIFDEPTKGVDVGAKKDIFTLIAELAKRGKCVIYATCELSELMGITDRTYVLYDGKIVKELETKNTNEEELLFYSTGGIPA